MKGIVFIICSVLCFLGYLLGVAIAITIGALLLWGAGTVLFNIFALNFALTFGQSWLIVFALWAIKKLLKLIF